MPSEYEILRPVAQSMRAGKGKALVGAGASVPSGLRSWLGLLAPVVKEGLGIELTKWDDLTEIAEFYAARVSGGRDRLVTAIAADIARPNAPCAIHTALAALPLAECWTTNFDTLLEESMPGHAVVGSDADLVLASRGPKPLLVKMHGSLTSPLPTQEQIQRLVLTRDDFDLFRERHPRLWSRLVSGYLGGAMLFVGLSLTDPNMRLLQKLARAAQDSGVDTSSVVVMKVPDHEQDRLRFEPRMADLARSGVTVHSIDHYDELVGVLERLRDMLRPPRVIISGSTYGMDTTDARRTVEASERLGSQLAQRNIPVVTGGSEVGAALSRRLAATAGVFRGYDPAAITTLRRRSDDDGAEYLGYQSGRGKVSTPRVGTIRFVGETLDEMRDEMLQLGCVGALIGGGHGSSEEVDALLKSGVAVVPWPATGGEAAKRADLLDNVLELLPSPAIRSKTRFALLGPDLELGAAAMANLLEAVQGPYADTGPTGAASGII